MGGPYNNKMCSPPASAETENPWTNNEDEKLQRSSSTSPISNPGLCGSPNCSSVGVPPLNHPNMHNGMAGHPISPGYMNTGMPYSHGYPSQTHCYSPNEMSSDRSENYGRPTNSGWQAVEASYPYHQG